MIERYSRDEMVQVWSEETKFETWLTIEKAICLAQANEGIIPLQTAQNINSKAKFDISRIKEIEGKVKHEILAFLKSVEESIGEDSNYLHFGITSSDILDTCTSIQIQKASELLLLDLIQIDILLLVLAKKYKHTLCIGRTHGMNAEPTTFGYKCLVWLMECKRNIKRLMESKESNSVCKIGGAVGTYENTPRSIQQAVANKLELKSAFFETQIIQRDRIAEFICSLAICASFVEKVATEIRNLQRSGIEEVEEFFGKDQKGSSAMPHKHNPISCENLCGLSRMIRSYVGPALEDNVLWHERDISHSSVERIILPDATILLDYMLVKLYNILTNLNVNEKKMLSNLENAKPQIYSEKLLLTLMKKGMKRSDAYDLVQSSIKDDIMDYTNISKFLSENEISNTLNNANLFVEIDKSLFQVHENFLKSEYYNCKNRM